MENEWKYLRSTNELLHRLGYHVDLDKCRTSAEVLDLIFQVFNKNWCTETAVWDLLVRIQERIDPQRNLCSFGVEVVPGTSSPLRLIMVCRDCGKETCECVRS